MDLVEVEGYRFARDRADLTLHAGESVVAGGTWLFSEPQPGTTGLVDLTTLGWVPWEQRQGGLHVSATCTLEGLQAVPPDVLGPAAELVRECAEALLMSFKVQSHATVGGNVCLALPAGAMISLFTALETEALVWTPGGGERRELLADLVQGARRTSLARGEVLRRLDVPAAALHGSRYAFRRASLSPLGRSAAVVVARAAAEGSAGTSVTVTASTTRPVVLRADERGELEAGLDAIDCWWTDAHGAPDWREAMTRRLAHEAVAEVTG